MMLQEKMAPNFLIDPCVRILSRNKNREFEDQHQVAALDSQRPWRYLVTVTTCCFDFSNLVSGSQFFGSLELARNKITGCDGLAATRSVIASLIHRDSHPNHQNFFQSEIETSKKCKFHTFLRKVSSSIPNNCSAPNSK